jgi:hypothetical protein
VESCYSQGWSWGGQGVPPPCLNFYMGLGYSPTHQRRKALPLFQFRSEEDGRRTQRAHIAWLRDQLFYWMPSVLTQENASVD